MGRSRRVVQAKIGIFILRIRSWTRVDHSTGMGRCVHLRFVGLRFHKAIVLDGQFVRPRETG